MRDGDQPFLAKSLYLRIVVNNVTKTKEMLIVLESFLCTPDCFDHSEAKP
jgi:hypothetical protein